MKTYSDQPLPTYDVSGHEVRVHWGATEKQKEFGTAWEQNEALCSIFDDRPTLISAIIRSVYSVDDELATINNAADRPDEYADYQAFRAQAKALADGWLAVRSSLVAP